jgi:hypothetical protein
MKNTPTACRREHLPTIPMERHGGRIENASKNDGGKALPFMNGPEERLMKCNLRTWLMLNGPCRSLATSHESNVIGSGK